MAKSLEGKVVVVTGSAFGIGRSIALQAAEAGASVALADLAAEATAGQKAADECVAAGAPAAKFVACDVSVGSDVAALMETAAETFGAIDVIYANAGVVSRLVALPPHPPKALCRGPVLPAGDAGRLGPLGARGGGRGLHEGRRD
eukprot:COSAG04_NODE_7099_length_1192_cov_1.052150_1_plen_145_part_00